jgi:hypothetical protein
LAGHLTPGESSEVRRGDPKVRVTSSAVKRAVAVGDNFLSEMYRVAVTTVGDDQLEDRSQPLREKLLKVNQIYCSLKKPFEDEVRVRESESRYG